MRYLLVMAKGLSKSPGYSVFPSGIAYVSAAMKKSGLEVYTSNLEYFKGKTEDVLDEQILGLGIDVVCTTGLSRDYAKVKEIIDVCNSCEKDVITVVGGGIITGDYDAAMSALGANIGVIGEGEPCINHLGNLLERGYDKEASTPYYIVGEEIKDLDTIPFPDYDGFAFSKYLDDIGRERGYIIASRGCAFGCTFCARPGSRKYRQRSLDNVFKEVELLVEGYGLKHIIISDEMFAAKRDRVIEFCDRVTQYGITWALQLRVTDVDGPLLRTMKTAGCKCVSYGVESADDRILKSMNKKITLFDIEKALEATRGADIDIQGGFIFGDAEETEETAAKTLEWWEEHREYGLELNMINVFPGTKLYEIAVERGTIRDRVQYLKDGCPLINVSKLTNEQYNALASLVYETNIQAKYEPKKRWISWLYGAKGVTAVARVECNKCGNRFAFPSDGMHVVRAICPKCNQRHYFDPFGFLSIGLNLEMESLALWGAGELCLKLLSTAVNSDAYPSIMVVDSSLSRQGFYLFGKPIQEPSMINWLSIKNVIVTVIARKEEILESLKAYPSVERILVPKVSLFGDVAALTLVEIHR